MNNIALLPNWFIAIYVVLFGLCIGSFLNVVILRGLNGEDIVFERSKCPKCQNQLKWYMNIPLVSYLFLRGKCAFCKTKISWQYPLVEFITAMAFLASFFAFGLTLKTLFICIFLSIFIALSATDFIETVIIDYHAYILLGFGLLYSLLGLGNVSIMYSVIAAIAGFLIFEILARIGLLIANHRMFGEGDSLIALGLGAIFGFKNLLILIALSILIQAICAVPILAKNAFADKKSKLGLSYILILVSMAIVFLINYFDMNYNGILYILTTIILIALLFFSLKNILKEIQEKKNSDKEEKFCLLPFGPALIFAATLCIFYLPQIKKIILNFLF